METAAQKHIFLIITKWWYLVAKPLIFTNKHPTIYPIIRWVSKFETSKFY